MSKSVSWWIVVINYGGVSKPIRCYKPGEGLLDSPVLWDSSGNFECTMKAGVWPIGSDGEDSECSQFQSASKREAELFYSGAKAVSKLLNGIFTT